MLNNVFSIHGMVSKEPPKLDRSIDRALKKARDLGMNQRKFAAAMGVSAQDVTNWKSRGMPPERLEKASEVVDCSVDELLGRDAPKDDWGVDLHWPFHNVPFIDFENLYVDQKADIGDIVEDRVRRFKAKNGPRRRKKSRDG